MMNKLWLQGLEKEYNKAEKALPRLTAEDIAEDTHVRMVFITASPVLTNEVKQYYARLKHELSSHLASIEELKQDN